jgi:two-component system sensor histidine kinase CpxA
MDLSARSLFVKIFLWFWLATAVAGGAMLLLATAGEDARTAEAGRRGAEERRQAMARTLVFYGETARAIASKEGPGALEEYSERLARTTGIRPFFFLDDDPAARREGPPDVVGLATRTFAEGRTLYATHGDEFVLAQPLPGPAGRRQVVVGKTRLAGTGPARPAGEPSAASPLAGWLRRDARALGRDIAVLAAVGGLSCLLLAWHLTAPLERLRGVALRLAGGDLATRVDAGLMRRGDEIGELAEDLDRMAARIDELVRSQERLLRDISHELRSPLARLNVALELARDAGPEETAALHDRIGRESERLNELIGRLLTLARLSDAGGAAGAATVDIAALAAEVADDAGFEARAAGRDVVLAVEGNADAPVRGDRELLRQAIENVVRNALRYAPEGTSVEIAVAATPEEVSVTVRDRGPGVPAGELSAIFRPFHRVSDGRERESGGAGIGLAITERAIRRHGGTVRAENAAGGGLSVRIGLPPVGFG